MDLGLTDRVVMISGAYRGTGAGTARVFAREGARVVVHGFEAGQADAVVAGIRDQGGQAMAVHGSLDADADVDTMVSGIEDQWGPVEVLVNNYGGPGRSTWSTPADAWSEGWNRNVVTAVRLTQRVVPAMRSAGWGRIIVLGTVGTERPGDRTADYYGAKGALVVLVRSLAKELRGTGVTANLVSPGMIATDEVRSGIQRRAEAEGIEGWEAAARWALQTTMPNLTERIPDPEDIGRMVAFVASEAAWHLTGSDLKADGGALDA